MSFDEGEGQLHRCHAELVRSQIFDGAAQLTNAVLEDLTTMVGSVVEQEDGVLSPVWILLIELSDYLLDEQQHRHAIVLALIHCEESIACVGDPQNDGHHLHSLH